MAKQKPGTKLAKWDEELARQAKVAADMEANVAGGQFFSLKSGVLSFNDSPLPGNQMAVVIVDSVLENVYYPGEYDADNPSGPSCFAFGRNEADLKPHLVVVEADQAEHEACAGCPQNEWGTAEKGKGKACRNVRRLALLPAGTINVKTDEFEPFDEDEHWTKTPIAFLKLPVTSVKAYAAYVKQLAGTLKRPPFGVYTKIGVVPDAKTQFKVTFDALSIIEDPTMGMVFERNKEVQSVIDFPYQLDEPEEKKPKGKQKQRKY